MNFGKVWISMNELPGGWLERSQADELDLREAIEVTVYNLDIHGHHVVLASGKDSCFVDAFYFKRGEDAHDFYDSGFRKWKSFLEDKGRGYSLHRISLYCGGNLVVTKSCAPTDRNEVKHG